MVVTLRFSILFIFISLYILTSSLITVVTSIRYTKSLTYVASELMDHVSASVSRELITSIRPAAAETLFSAKLIEQGVLKENQEQLIPYTLNLVKTLPSIVGVYWSDIYGNLVYSRKELDGTVSTEIYNRKTSPATRLIIYRDKEDNSIKKVVSTDLQYDPRLRPWYVQVEKEKKSIWTDIYIFKPVNDLGITSASPIFKKGAFYGAFGIDINLGYLSKFVNQQKIKNNGFTFIITKKGKLIANPQNAIFAQQGLSKEEFRDVNKVSLPLISRSLDKYLHSKQNSRVFSYRHDGENYMVSYEPIKALESFGWLVGVIVPEKDFTSDLQKMHQITLFFCAIILILGALLVSSLITHIMSPIKLLVQETEKIKLFELDGELTIKSRIKEIIYLRDAIHSMKIGLKLFQKYIPKILVKQLIESGEDIRIGGVRKQLAVFFSDIENFATISEKTDPNLLMNQLGEYFEELTLIIISERGTIDKYIGDSIMAFWGSPLREALPCQHAASAALRCQLKLDELNDKWEKEGKARLFTRIGIHSGEAIVGNLGSSERLNYTAVGDTINVASRLENINKNYKTKIIVSDAVYEEIKDRFTLRLVDCVVVKGRTKSSHIYELLSDKDCRVEFNVTAYRPIFAKGFKAYQQQHWDKAISYFKQCLEVYPEDNIAPIFIERCTQFKVTPPPAEWKGIMY